MKYPYPMRLLTNFTLFLAISIGIAGNAAIGHHVNYQHGCSLIEKKAASLSLVYHHKDETKHLVWLRLYNNTTCGIRLNTNYVNPQYGEYARYFKIQTIERGNGVIEYLPRFDPPPEGAPLPIFYDVEDWKHKKSPRPGNYREDADVQPQEILPGGKSVLFGVKLEYIRKGYGIAVTFEYEWERGGTESVVHRVFADPFELKKAIVKK